MKRVLMSLLFIGAIAGCEGPPGEQGARGVTGPQGQTGQTGEDGQDGMQMIWSYQGTIPDQACDYDVHPPAEIKARISDGYTLCTLELRMTDGLNYYWVMGNIVWWFQNDYPEAQTLMFVREDGMLNLWNACGGAIRIRVFG